jgi:zinc D-Ala-D-Ala carboxypeptidase
VPTGSVVVITGKARNNFLPVKFDGDRGWISKAYVDLGDASPGGTSGGNGGTVETTDYVNFRSGPGLDRSVIRVLPPGTEVRLNSEEEHGFLFVTHNGQNGWIFRDYLTAAGDNENDTMVVLDDLNLRDGPSTADGVILVMPAGAVVIVTGSIDNGFYPVRYRGEEGWAHYKYLK